MGMRWLAHPGTGRIAPDCDRDIATVTRAVPVVQIASFQFKRTLDVCAQDDIVGQVGDELAHMVKMALGDF